MSDTTKEIKKEFGEHKTLLIALVCGLIITAVVILIMQGKGQDIGLKKPLNESGNVKKVQKEEQVNGVLSLESMSGRVIYTPQETFSLVLKGDSAGQEVVGYDAALNVDQKVIVFSQIESLLPLFDTFDNVNNTRVYLGGIKKLDTKDQIFFNNTALADIKFTALQQGIAPISFNFTPDDTTESNLVLKTSRDGLADVKGVTIYVGGMIKLAKVGSQSVIPSKDITLKLISQTSDTTTLEIAKAGTPETRTFSTGVESAYGYVFQVEKAPSGGVTVYYAVAN